VAVGFRRDPPLFCVAVVGMRKAVAVHALQTTNPVRWSSPAQASVVCTAPRQAVPRRGAPVSKPPFTELTPRVTLILRPCVCTCLLTLS